MKKDLNALLATTAVLAQKTHNLHWHIKGVNFMEIHKMTDEVYEGLNGFIDEIAEKIIMQGGVPTVTLTEYVANSAVKEVKETSFTAKEVIEIMANDLDIYMNEIAAIESNIYIQPLLDELIMFTDKHRWFFQASAK